MSNVQGAMSNSRPMKDSGVEWIGEIPENWIVVPLKKLGIIQTGNTPPKSDGNPYFSDTYGVPWIKAENLGYRSPISQTVEYLTDEGCKEGRLFPPYTVFVCCIASVGKVGFSEVPCSCNQQINGIVFNERYHWKYGYYVSTAQETEYLNSASGNVIKIINSDKQSNLLCPVPPVAEQRRIAGFLDRRCAEIDGVIEATKKTIEEYKALKQSIIAEAVTGQCAIGNVQGAMGGKRRMKDSGIEWIDEIPEEWEIKKLKLIADFIQQKYSENDGILDYIGLENIASWNGQYVETSSEYDREQSLVCEKGDILFGKLRPYLAKVYISDEKQCCSSEFAVIRSNERINTRFLWYQLISHGFVFMVDRSTYGTKMPRANSDFIKNMVVSIPPITEQQTIAEHLDSKCLEMDKLILSKQQLLAELETYKKSVVYEYVTGKRLVV